jgi:hypothetical protein
VTTLDGYVANELYLARARGLHQAAQGARLNLEAAKAARGQRPHPGRRPWWQRTATGTTRSTTSARTASISSDD